MVKVIMLRSSAGRPTQGFRATGRTAVALLLPAVLVSALFAAPLVATHLDFNHTHPEGTEPHVHDIDTVLITAVIAPIVSVTTVFGMVAMLLLRVPALAFRPRVDPAHPVRAPPLLT